MSHSERIVGKGCVQNSLNSNTPFLCIENLGRSQHALGFTHVGNISNYFSDFERNCLAFGYHRLHCTRTHDMTKSRLGTFNECLSKIRNTTVKGLLVVAIQCEFKLTMQHGKG